MTAPVLNAREWLETIVATGAQRSGFAQDALEMLDIAEDAMDGEQAWVDVRDAVDEHLSGAPGNGPGDKAEWVGKHFDELIERGRHDAWQEVHAEVLRRLDQYGEILQLLQDAGVVAVGDVPDDLPGLLAMFVHP